MIWLRLIERAKLVSPTDVLLTFLLKENHELLKITQNLFQQLKQKRNQIIKIRFHTFDIIPTINLILFDSG